MASADRTCPPSGTAPTCRGTLSRSSGRGHGHDSGRRARTGGHRDWEGRGSWKSYVLVTDHLGQEPGPSGRPFLEFSSRCESPLAACRFGPAPPSSLPQCFLQRGLGASALPSLPACQCTEEEHGSQSWPAGSWGSPRNPPKGCGAKSGLIICCLVYVDTKVLLCELAGSCSRCSQPLV